MTPFENLIQELSLAMGIELHPDSHFSCLITFPTDDISVQIDLDTSGDQILIGSQLGRISAGPYRERVFFHAMRINGGSLAPRGILAFSEKNDTLILFQFLSLAFLDGEKLNQFITIFRAHAKAWKEALERGELPEIEGDTRSEKSGTMFGLKP